MLDCSEKSQRGGVERIVLLSGRGEAGAERSEDAVRHSGADTTILRCSWFNQNVSEGHLLEPVRGGEIAFPAVAVAEPFIDADDIADVVAEYASIAAASGVWGE